MAGLFALVLGLGTRLLLLGIPTRPLGRLCLASCRFVRAALTRCLIFGQAPDWAALGWVGSTGAFSVTPYGAP